MKKCNLEGVGDGQTPKEVQTLENKGAAMATDDQDNISKFSLTSITIITTVTYAAAFQLPGGYDSKTGMPVLRTHPAFQLFLGFNSLSFVCSAVGMFIHYFKISEPKKRTTPTSLKLLDILTYFSIALMPLAYWMSLRAVFDRSKDQSWSKWLSPKIIKAKS